MSNPKDLMTAAALATLRADPDADQRTEVALKALNEQRKVPQPPAQRSTAMSERAQQAAGVPFP